MNSLKQKKYFGLFLVYWFIKSWIISIINVSVNHIWMTRGYLYVLWNPVYEKYGPNVYKLGKTVSLRGRKSSYSTPYIEESVYKHTSKYLDDMDMAEKILLSYGQ